MNDRRIAVRFPATMPGFETAFGQLRGALDHEALPNTARYQIELVFEEIVANVVRHGAIPGGEVQVEVSLELQPDRIDMCFKDDGLRFDPCGQPDVTLPTSLDRAPVGGLGLLMVRKAATGMRYERTADEHNRLLVTLPLTVTPPAR